MVSFLLIIIGSCRIIGRWILEIVTDHLEVDYLHAKSPSLASMSILAFSIETHN